MNKRQRGFSLVELMIALVLGLVLVGGAINTFLASRQTYVLQEATSRVQEAGRFSMDLIARELRAAGTSEWALSVPALQGYANRTSIPSVVVNTATSEILFIRNHDARTGDTALYIAPDATSGIPTLFIGTEPMVEGIANINFLYGEDSDDDKQVDSFSALASVADWSNVIAVRVSVLAVGGQGMVVETPQILPAPFAGTAPDNRLYRVFNETVSLRNASLDKLPPPP